MKTRNSYKKLGILALAPLWVTGMGFSPFSCGSGSSSSDSSLNDIGSDQISNLTGSAVVIAPTDATLSSGELQLTNSNAIIGLTPGSAAVYSQCGSPSGGLSYSSPLTSSGGALETDIPFTPAVTITTTQVTLTLKKVGSPTGEIVVGICPDSGGDPSCYALFQSLGTNAATLSTSGAAVNFSVYTPITLTAGTPYHFVLYGNPNSPYYTATGGAGVEIAYMSSSDCGNSMFGALQDSSNYSSFSPYSGKAQAQIYASHTYATDSPTATYTVDSSASGATWVMSSFVPVENPLGNGGSLTYDVGAADNTTPTYSLSGKTSAQLAAASNLTGRYLFIRAHFTSGGFQNVSLGNIGIGYIP